MIREGQQEPLELVMEHQNHKMSQGTDSDKSISVFSTAPSGRD